MSSENPINLGPHSELVIGVVGEIPATIGVPHVYMQVNSNSLVPTLSHIR